MKKLIVLFALATLAGCQPAGHHVAKPKESNRVEAYRVQQADDTWLYYYIWYTTFNNNVSTYYTTSTTPLTSYSSSTFTKVSDELPAELSRSEALGEQQITEADIPSNIEADISAQEAAYSEYAETQGEIDSANNAAEGTVDSTDSGSYDSGGSDAGGSADSGGGDAGGGGGE